MRDGAMANAQLTNYIVPTTLDTPPIDVVLLEKPYAHGPFGAKGVGEMPIDGVAPAVVNAIRQPGRRRPGDSGDAGTGDGGAETRSRDSGPRARADSGRADDRAHRPIVFTLNGKRASRAACIR